MKKVIKSVTKQARRQGALNRFSIKPTDNVEYLARKRQELAALKSVLGQTS